MLEASSYELDEAEKKIIDALSELGAGVFDEDDIVQRGRKLVIPEGMTLRNAVDFIRSKIRESEKETVFSRTYRYRPLDGAACMYRAMKRNFGSVGHRGKMGFWGELSPEMRSIPIAINKTEQVPWGRFSLPFLPDTLFETGEHYDPELGSLFHLSATGPKMFSSQIEGVFKIVEDELETASIYRGKAIDGKGEPDFIDLSGIDPKKVVYNDDVLMQMEASLWAQLKHTEEMEARGVPLKRAVLITGPYGTGKTLAAGITGQIAVANDWTYIKARPGRDDFLAVLQTARLYQPAVVFCEDVDNISDPNLGDGDTITRLLDDFDGIDSKDTHVLCVLTTNHPDRIHKGMLRPGRLDAVIKIDALDHHGVERMIKAVVDDDLLDPAMDWMAVGEAMTGFKPAFVREAADRAVRYSIVRGNGKASDRLRTDDLCGAADGLRPQLEMMEEASDTAVRDPLSQAVARAVAPAVEDVVRRTVSPSVLTD